MFSRGKRIVNADIAIFIWGVFMPLKFLSPKQIRYDYQNYQWNPYSRRAVYGY